MVKVTIISAFLLFLLIYHIIEFMYTPGYFSGLTLNKKIPHNNLPPLTHRVCSNSSCPWQSYSLSSQPQEQLSESSSLHINEGNDIPLTCQPTTFGYTGAEFSRIFKNKTFNTCEEVSGIYESIIHINSSSRELYMSCDGEYYLGQPADEEMLGYEGYNTKAKKYKGPVSLNKGQEWAFGKCKGEKIQGATYEIFVKEETKRRVKARMEEIQEKINKGSKTQPITVINLFLDSISRKSFYRKLPITHRFLNSLNESGYKVYDFKLNSVVADNSLPNLYPIWTGLKYPDYSPEEQLANKDMKKDLIENFSIWKHLSDSGFATMFGAEFCNPYFSYGIGRKPKVDHLLTRFWCGANKLTDFNDVAQYQRCLGNKNSHFYMFNYTLQFIKAYQGLNKWAHLMSVPAHEDSGTVISTVDSDLTEFLTNLMKPAEDLVIFIAADHGMRFGEWYKLENGGQEHRLPMLFTIISKNLLERMKYSDDILTHNSNRLVTKYDIHKTLLHLAKVPYDSEYSDKKDFPLYNESTSLLRHKIPDDRSCEEIGIDAEYCPCTRYIDYEDLDDDIVLDTTLIVVQEINSGAAFHKLNGRMLCREISLKKIIAARWAAQEYKLLIKTKFTINEVENVIFESIVMIFGTFMKHRPNEESYPFAPYYLAGKRWIRVTSITNNYENQLCYELSIFKGIHPNLCICREFQEIKLYEAELISEYQRQFTFKSTGYFESCSQQCSQTNQTCSEAAIMSANTCADLNSHISSTGCSRCFTSNDMQEFGIIGGICYTSNQYLINACSLQSHLRKPCVCV